MIFEMTEEQKAIKTMAKKFAEKRLTVITQKDEEKHLFRREIINEMGALGILGTVIPEEYGGSNVGFLTTVLITEELARVSASYSTYSMSQAVGPGLAILNYGTEYQKNKYLHGLCTGNLLACFGSTEPDVGSDVLGMKTIALEEKDCFILNGSKAWITNGPVSDIGLFWAYTDKKLKKKGISCFIVNLKNNPGISVSPYSKLGLWCTVTGEVVFDAVRVPKECLLGSKGEGYHILMETLGNTRLCAAARAVGVGRACLEDSIRYAKDRNAFGQPIGNFQMIQSQLAEMYIEHEAARQLVYQAALNKDRGIQDIIDVAVAKYFATKMAVKAADTALEIYGSYGFSMEYPIQRYIRDSRAFPITEGTSNIQKIIIAKYLLR